jgi:arginine repressor
MRKYKALIFVTSLSIFMACSTEDNNTQDTTQNFIFEDGFETQNDLLDELFPSNDTRWSTIQQTNPSNAINEISIINTESTEGQNALRFLAYQSDVQLSKMDIEKNGLNIRSGDEVTITADFYINGTEL